MQNARTNSERKQRSVVVKYRASLFLKLLLLAAACVSQTVTIASERLQKAPGAAWRECGCGRTLLVCRPEQDWIPGAVGHQTILAPHTVGEGVFTVFGDQA